MITETVAHTTTEELLEAVFSVRPLPRLYNVDQLPLLVSPFVKPPLLNILTCSLPLYSYQKDEWAKPGDLLTK
jgi:hypothetical protein